MVTMGYMLGYEWIDVKERLPERFVSVLCQMPGEEPCPTVREGFLTDKGIWHVALYDREPGEVTHWLPMPKPPKKSNSLGKPENCEYYTTNCFWGGGGCLGTREIDPCEGKDCKRYKPKMDGGAEDV